MQPSAGGGAEGITGTLSRVEDTAAERSTLKTSSFHQATLHFPRSGHLRCVRASSRVCWTRSPRPHAMKLVDDHRTKQFQAWLAMTVIVMMPVMVVMSVFSVCVYWRHEFQRRPRLIFLRHCVCARSVGRKKGHRRGIDEGREGEWGEKDGVLPCNAVQEIAFRN